MQHNNPIKYLITPSEFELNVFSKKLEKVLDEHEVACVRLEQSTRDEMIIGKSADTLREICHKRDIPLIIESHFMLVEKFGLDGVHLNDGSKSIRAARKILGKESIVGAYCFQSKHDGINATEAGADYVKTQMIHIDELTFRPQFEEGLKVNSQILSIKRSYKLGVSALQCLTSEINFSKEILLIPGSNPNFFSSL